MRRARLVLLTLVARAPGPRARRAAVSPAWPARLLRPVKMLGASGPPASAVVAAGPTELEGVVLARDSNSHPRSQSVEAATPRVVPTPEDYASYLVRLAGGRMRRRARVAVLPALGIDDLASNLHRRVAMLVTDREPLERRCPAFWSLGAMGAIGLALLIASGLRLDAAAPRDEPKPVAEKAALAAPETTGGETLHYSVRTRPSVSGRSSRTSSSGRPSRSSAGSRHPTARRPKESRSWPSPKPISSSRVKGRSRTVRSRKP